MKLQVALIFIMMALVAAKFEVRDRDDALRAHEECREDYNIPDEIYEQYTNYEFPDHKRTKCYVKCWVEKMGLFKERKGYDEEAIVTQFSREHPQFLANVRHGLEKCIDHNESESDVCTFAHRVFSCWLKINRPASLVSADLDAKEGRVIAECLDRFGGPTLENAQRLQRFKQWSDTYEEIPCFTNCYLNKMFDFYNETKGFHGPNVIKQFGNVIYEACKAKLVEGNNPCEVAYNGFHCMVNLENDPFVVIESMPDLNADAKLAMKDCLHKFDQFEWQKFGEYSSYPVKEPIPCYTRCFVEKLQLFNHRLRKWNTKSMLENLGFPEENANISACLAMGQRRTRNSCAWMYREFVCFLMSRNVKNVEKKL